jgi:hypothetical protein
VGIGARCAMARCVIWRMIMGRWVASFRVIGGRVIPWQWTRCRLLPTRARWTSAIGWLTRWRLVAGCSLTCPGRSSAGTLRGCAPLPCSSPSAAAGPPTHRAQPPRRLAIPSPGPSPPLSCHPFVASQPTDRSVYQKVTLNPPHPAVPKYRHSANGSRVGLRIVQRGPGHGR